MLNNIYTCDICGCLLHRSQEKVHDDWHKNLDNTARESHRAHCWLNPIG